MMYINPIWGWRRSEVYILILPAFAVSSEVITTSPGSHLFGQGSMVMALQRQVPGAL
jgi:heme/copper-type cytochrome/quinol oxidase subunit 1